MAKDIIVRGYVAPRVMVFQTAAQTCMGNAQALPPKIRARR